MNTITIYGNSLLESLIISTKSLKYDENVVAASIKFLLDHGANIFKKDALNGDSVRNAFLANSSNVCKLLIKFGFDPVKYRSYGKRSLVSDMIHQAEYEKALDFLKNYKFNMFDNEECGVSILEAVEKSKVTYKKATELLNRKKFLKAKIVVKKGSLR